MKKINYLILSIILLTTAAFAQNVDQERMARDIEVAENILTTLMKQEIKNQRGFPYVPSIEGKYLADYGVIFTIPNNITRFSRVQNAVSVGTGNVLTIDNRGDGYTYAVIANSREEAESKVKIINVDSIQSVRKELIIEVMKTFLADYGNLISQLKPSQKILITNRDRQFVIFNNKGERNELAVEAKISDIEAYKAGKMSRGQLMEIIKVTDKKVSDEKYTDLELLSSIFERLYRSDLSDTYYLHGRIPYDRLSDFGVIYRMKVVSSSGDNDNHMITTRNITGLTQAERDKIVKDMYPEFVAGLKRNILDYGKTVSTLKNNEILLFQVELTKCLGCDIPKAIELSVKNEVLQQYGMGKLSRDKAIGQISVQEGELQ